MNAREFRMATLLLVVVAFILGCIASNPLPDPDGSQHWGNIKWGGK